MAKFIVLTTAGYTETANCEEVNNMQVLGFSEASSIELARLKYIADNPGWVVRFGTDTLVLYELKG